MVLSNAYSTPLNMMRALLATVWRCRSSRRERDPEKKMLSKMCRGKCALKVSKRLSSEILTLNKLGNEQAFEVLSASLAVHMYEIKDSLFKENITYVFW